jgi:hypothetical protein
MRTWIGGVGLAAVTCGGVYFVSAGAGHPSHCGPCFSGKCGVPKAPVVARPESPLVVDVLDVTRLTLPPTEPARLPFRSFDEPPLVVMSAVGEEPGAIVQAGFTAPATIPPAGDDVELAPAPRKAGPRLAGPADPF